MVVSIFGKADCAKCTTAKNKVNHFLDRWGLEKKVEVEFHDMGTIEGMAEGSFHDVLDVPTTIVQRDGQQVARWDGDPPKSEELRSHLEVAVG